MKQRYKEQEGGRERESNWNVCHPIKGLEQLLRETQTITQLQLQRH